MLVNEDKLDQVLSSAKKQLQTVNRSHNLALQQPNSSLSLGMPKHNFYGAGGAPPHSKQAIHRGSMENSEYYSDNR